MAQRFMRTELAGIGVSPEEVRINFVDGSALSLPNTTATTNDMVKVE